MMEVDIALSKQFIMEVMKRCWQDHDGSHCHAHCSEAIECTPETCPVEIEDDEDWDWEREHFGSRHHHEWGPENVSLIDIKYLGEATGSTYDCSHTVELCYTTGSKCHKWHALYGVNEETGLISIWMN
jgi:hypothetical protein